jgi:hypothetical protein
MLWMDYLVESFPDGSFTVKGDWPGEVMGIKEDGTPKQHHLYKPGDVFVVNENGILKKSDELMIFLQKGLEQKNAHSDNNTC